MLMPMRALVRLTLASLFISTLLANAPALASDGGGGGGGGGARRRIWLRFDCHRFRPDSRNYEGLGSMFREVRGIFYLAFALGIDASVADNVPTSGHGGDISTTRRYLASEEAEGGAGAGGGDADDESTVELSHDAVSAISGWFQENAGAIGSPCAPARGSAAGGRSSPSCGEALLARVPRDVRDGIVAAISDLRRRKSPGRSVLVLRAPMCPVVMFDNFFLPQADKTLRGEMAASRARRRMATAKEAGTKICGKGTGRSIAVAMHHRTGDLLLPLVSDSGRRGAIAPSEGCMQRLHDSNVTTANVLSTIRGSIYNTSRGMDGSGSKFLDGADIDWCAWESAFSAAPPTSVMWPCCQEQEEGSGGESYTWNKFPVHRYANVLRAVVGYLRRLPNVAGSTIEATLFSQAPENFYADLVRSFANEPGVNVRVTGGGTGSSLLSPKDGRPPDLDNLVDADVLILGEGNLSRMAGYLNLGGVVLQLGGCTRSGHLVGERVVDVAHGGALDKEDFESAWARTNWVAAERAFASANTCEEAVKEL